MTATAPETDGPDGPDAAPEPEQRVTALELFFDLVFVFAITQVTAFIAHDPDAQHLIEGLAVLTAVWWAWGCYAWLGNTAGTDDGLFRVILLAAMAAMAVAAIAVPRAFGADALAFGVAYACVRVLHIAAYAQLARHDPTLRVVVLRLGRAMVPTALLFVLAGLVGEGTPRYVCWAVAITMDVASLYVQGVEGWRVQAGHLAERHGLIIIIALGESIVSVGVGAEGQAMDADLIAGVLLGMAAAAALWWAYFDVVALVAERRFREATGLQRVLIARDSYTYLHFPMVAGIVLLALIVPATHVPALAALAVVAALTCGQMAYEFVHFHEARERLRHALT